MYHLLLMLCLVNGVQYQTLLLSRLALLFHSLAIWSDFFFCVIAAFALSALLCRFACRLLLSLFSLCSCCCLLLDCSAIISENLTG